MVRQKLRFDRWLTAAVTGHAAGTAVQVTLRIQVHIALAETANPASTRHFQTIRFNRFHANWDCQTTVEVYAGFPLVGWSSLCRTSVTGFWVQETAETILAATATLARQQQRSCSYHRVQRVDRVANMRRSLGFRSGDVNRHYGLVSERVRFKLWRGLISKSAPQR